MELRDRAASGTSCCGRARWKLLFVVVFAVVGIGVALAALAPTVLSKRGAGWAERHFANEYAGRLAIGSLDLAWRDPQALHDVTLSGPDGERIGRATVELPSLWQLLRGRGRELGAIAITATAELVTYPDGTTNLDRALAARVPEDRDDDDEDAGEVAVEDLPQVELVVDLERFVWRDAAGERPAVELIGTRIEVSHARGAPATVRVRGGVGPDETGGTFDLAADVVPDADEGLARPERAELHASATGIDAGPWLAWLATDSGARSAPPATAGELDRLELDLRALLSSDERNFVLDLTSGEAALDARGELFAVPVDAFGGGGSGTVFGLVPGEHWGVAVAGNARGLPVGLVDALMDRGSLASDTLGATIDGEFDLRVTGTSLADATGPVQVELSSPNADVVVAGSLAGGRFVAAENGRIALSLGLTPLVEERVVGSLVPIFVRPGDARTSADPRAARAAHSIQLILTDFRLDLDGALSGQSAAIALELGPLDLAFLPGIRQDLNLPLTFSVPAGTAFGLQLDSGIVRYDSLPITIDGERLPLGGTFDLTSRRLDLSGSIPASLWGKELEERLGVSGATLAKNLTLDFAIGGTPESPDVRLEQPDLSGVLGDTLREGLQGELEKALGDDFRLEGVLPKSSGRAEGVRELEDVLGGLLGRKRAPKKDEPSGGNGDGDGDSSGGDDDD